MLVTLVYLAIGRFDVFTVFGVCLLQVKVKARTRILVCAQSNAAIDEIILRVSIGEVLDKDGNRR